MHFIAHASQAGVEDREPGSESENKTKLIVF
jgi:hypothetical protein